MFPVETTSAITSAKSSEGAISTDPEIVCISAVIPSLDKNFMTELGYEVAILVPSKSAVSLIFEFLGTAKDNLHLEKFNPRTISVSDSSSSNRFEPTIPRSTTPSATYPGMSEFRRKRISEG
ncbi:hypothetical protein D3C71_890550 [compost metagenome]